MCIYKKVRYTEKKHFKNDKRCLSALKQVFHIYQRIRMKVKMWVIFYRGFLMKADLSHSLQWTSKQASTFMGKIGLLYDTHRERERESAQP